MKRALLLAIVLLGGCSTSPKRLPPLEPAAAPVADGDAIQRVPFRVGVSSHTVEQLAKAQACTSAQGAGRVTEPGAVEVYRVQCDDGKVFMARCELRQCRKM